jgi:hypothetical protein
LRISAAPPAETFMDWDLNKIERLLSVARARLAELQQPGRTLTFAEKTEHKRLRANERWWESILARHGRSGARTGYGV